VELSHSFTVPATVDRTWATFMDLPLVGGCFPGATVTEVTEEGFAGTVKVKLGPIALVYSGTGAFVERDDGAHRAVIEAKGKDKRGNGTAGATVTIQLTDVGDGSTRADVQTDLAVTGKPAQFGRGVMQDVSDKLLGQFIGCIEGKIGEVPLEEPPVAAAGGSPEPFPEPSPGASPEPELQPGPAAGPEPSPAPVPERAAGAESKDDALDLGSAVLPILLRSYGKQIVIGVVVVVAVIVIWRAISG
jgi:carbon monoxide dehydrogenase subunit G